VRRIKRFRVVLAVFVVLLTLASPAAAHLVTVSPTGGGKGTTHWVGGGPLPANAQGAALIPSPIGTLPPSHGAGLVHACTVTLENGTVLFIAPPFDPPDFDCRHG
jgi:hypothetical protein